ncbi:PepSY domain-containing protein [Neomegalonema sp.]|uniref:PepSY domain-containing protein n=1 Tax=Neomegalonema sp. TaxID=2039713 RepID=UPI0026122AEC|nr:PepSY domain-containing protein [Neomegalonema sp.]MDD2869519.1 PepSY domain-containing protein [Neomegalonema sp.]
MTRATLAVLLSTGALLAAPTLALADDRPPPAGALKLSEILSKVEAAHGVAYVDEADWDDDDGHWEIKFVSASGARTEIRVDPLTGEQIQRR